MGLSTLLVVLVYMGLVELIRVARVDTSIQTMDKHADQALSSLAVGIRQAVLPISYTNGNSAIVAKFNDRATGFGTHGNAWRDILRTGTDCLAFTTPADFGDDGDHFDSDMLPELGIVLPDGTDVPAGQYAMTEDANSLQPDGSLNPFLAGLDPVTDLHLQSNRGKLDISLPRFASTFSFPAGDAGYGIIRFVPHYANNVAFVVSENRLQFDLNADGDLADEYVLGGLQAIYPNAVRQGNENRFVARSPGTAVATICGPSILLQTNQNGNAWTPLFKLVRYRESDDSINAASYDENSAEGDNAVLIRFLMCNQAEQLNDPVAFGNRFRAVVRQYETVVKLRNIP